ncbi:hypothetical protein OG921_04835 [Aldersonia sp. NBC_00410]|uniref:hypothetical protein n=1 Tax=Aldersonia sp. NBC_00410 TaxID=2975954 RepID=UPI00224D660E|nr:hypothetical protein [Aldersonia sp. NBC_00410]MCX5042497.1 hypothetical protein [Aldersonia sp. NBC_00410]
MIPARRYRDLSPELRVTAVEKVRMLSPQVSSRWRAIQLVAEAIGVSPNTLRSWVSAAPEPVPTRAADDGRAERERTLQLATQAELIRDLTAGPQTRTDKPPIPHGAW